MTKNSYPQKDVLPVTLRISISGTLKGDAKRRPPVTLRISISGTLKGDAKRRPPVPLADKYKWHP